MKIVIIGLCLCSLFSASSSVLSPWEKIAEDDWKHLSIAEDGTTWAVRHDDSIHRKICGETQWEQIYGALIQVSAVDKYTAWGVNNLNDIFRWNEGVGWTQVPGKLTHVSASVDGTVWGVNTDFHGYIFQYDGTLNTWYQIGGQLKQLDVSNSHNIWGCNVNDDVFRWVGGYGWQFMPGMSCEYVAAADDGTALCVATDKRLFQYSDGQNSWEELTDTMMAKVSIGGSLDRVVGTISINGFGFGFQVQRSHTCQGESPTSGPTTSPTTSPAISPTVSPTTGSPTSGPTAALTSTSTTPVPTSSPNGPQLFNLRLLAVNDRVEAVDILETLLNKSNGEAVAIVDGQLPAMVAGPLTLSELITFWDQVPSTAGTFESVPFTPSPSPAPVAATTPMPSTSPLFNLLLLEVFEDEQTISALETLLNKSNAEAVAIVEGPLPVVVAGPLTTSQLITFWDQVLPEAGTFQSVAITPAPTQAPVVPTTPNPTGMFGNQMYNVELVETFDRGETIVLLETVFDKTNAEAQDLVDGTLPVVVAGPMPTAELLALPDLGETAADFNFVLVV